MEPTVNEAMAEWAEESVAQAVATTPRNYRDVIAARFANTVIGRMEIRNLWTRNGFHHFRVNWWRTRPNGFEQYIGQSAFVTVEETKIGPVVSMASVRAA